MSYIVPDVRQVRSKPVIAGYRTDVFRNMNVTIPAGVLRE
jgi:hypothetical protein